MAKMDLICTHGVVLCQTTPMDDALIQSQNPAPARLSSQNDAMSNVDDAMQSQNRRFGDSSSGRDNLITHLWSKEITNIVDPAHNHGWPVLQKENTYIDQFDNNCEKTNFPRSLPFEGEPVPMQLQLHRKPIERSIPGLNFSEFPTSIHFFKPS